MEQCRHGNTDALRTALENLTFIAVKDEAAALLQRWNPPTEALLTDRATIEGTLMLAETQFYQGNAQGAEELLKPYFSEHAHYVQITVGLPMRYRLQLVEYYYSQRTKSDNGLQTAEELANELAKSCSTQDTTFERGEVLYFLMRIQHRRNQYESMGTLAMNAISAFTDSDPCDKPLPRVRWRIALVCLVYGIAAWRHGQNEQASARLHLAEWLLRTIEDPLNQARVNHSLGAMYRAIGNTDTMDKGYDLLKKARDGYEKNDHLNRARIHRELGHYWLFQDSFDRAEVEFAEAMGHAKQLYSRIQESEILMWKLWLAFYKLEKKDGDVDKIIRTGKQTLLLLDGMQGTHIAADLNLLIGQCYLRKKDGVSAEKSFTEALQIAKEYRLFKHEVHAELSLCHVYMDRDDVQAVKVHYLRAIEDVYPKGKFARSAFLLKKRKVVEDWLDRHNLNMFLRTSSDAHTSKMSMDARLKEYELWLAGQVYEAESKNLERTRIRLEIPRQRLSMLLEKTGKREVRKYTRTKNKRSKQTPKRKPKKTRGK